MSTKSWPKFFLAACTLSTAISAGAWNPFGPNNYDDCIIQNMKGVTSDTAAVSIRLSCLQKFPDKLTTTNQKETTRFGNPRLDVWDRPYNSRVFSNITIGRQKLNNYGGLEIPVTNKNEFNLAGIYIGIAANKKAGKCTIEKSDYGEIYECDGKVNSNTTSTLICPAPSGPWCVVGLKASFQPDVDKFFRDIAP